MQVRFSRRQALAMGLAATAPFAVRAQAAYPDPARPIRLVQGVPPGGSVDMLARMEAQYLTTALGASFVVDNRPGASNKIATDFTKKSLPDGYTYLTLGSSTPMIEAAQLVSGTERTFDTMRDFTMVGTLASNTYALVVTAELPVKTVNEFIAFAKAHPGYINYGSPGVAKTDHVAAELFSQRTGVKMVHVPFKGIGEAINQMIAGRIHACFSPLAPMAPHIKTGKLRLLAMVGATRNPMFPETPTIAEAVPLPGYAVSGWLGLVAPKKTPPEIVNVISTQLSRMARDTEFVKTQLLPNGMEAFYNSPSEMTAMFNRELDSYVKLFKAIDLKLVD